MTSWTRTDENGHRLRFTTTPDARGNVTLTREEADGLLRMGGWKRGRPHREERRPPMTINDGITDEQQYAAARADLATFPGGLDPLTAWLSGSAWARAHLAAQEPTESVLMTSREETISDRLSDAGYTEYAEDEDGGLTWVSAPLGEVLRIVSAAQEPTDAEVQAYLAAFSADLPPDTEWTPDTIERVKRGLSAARRGTARGGAMNPEDPHLRNLVAGAVMDAHGEWVPLSLRYRIAEKVLEALAPLVGEEVRAAQRVRDVHAIDADGNCGHCTRGRVYPVPAPCETVRALAGGGEER